MFPRVEGDDVYLTYDFKYTYKIHIEDVKDRLIHEMTGKKYGAPVADVLKVLDEFESLHLINWKDIIENLDCINDYYREEAKIESYK